jgi:MATE family multidrug resistance protein
MVGPLGPPAIGAVGVGNSLHFALSVFGMGLLLGLDALVSQAYGAGRFGDTRRWLKRGTALAALLTPAFLLLGFLVRLAIPHLGFHPDVMPPMRAYFSVLIWSTPFLLFYAAFRRYLQGVHFVTPVMFALVSANAVNATFNWFLIHGLAGFPKLGVVGSAWATLISRIYMAGVLLVAAGIARKRTASSAGAETLSSASADIRRLLSLGFPASAQITLEVGVFAAASALAGRLTPVAVASHQIALNIIAVSFMIPLGLASAGAVRVGYAVGAGAPARAAASGWMAIVLGVAFMACTATAFLAIPRVLIGLFSREAEVLAIASSLLFVGALFQLFDGVQGVLTGTLRGLGDTRTPMITNLAGHWLFGLPIGYLLCFPLGLGVIGLWFGLSIGLTIVAVILLIIWTKKIRTLVAAEDVLLTGSS